MVDVSYVNTILLAIVAFFGVMTFRRLDRIAEVTDDHSIRIARIETRCEDKHGRRISDKVIVLAAIGFGLVYSIAYAS